MNIIITLPQELIADILNGHKTIELRKTCPGCFRNDIDWVYVVTKGKASVQLAFQVTKFYQTSFFGQVWHVYHKRLCIPYDWFVKYTQNEPYVYLWHIGTIAYAEKPIPLSDIKPWGKAPQSYVYCETLIDSLPFTIMSDYHRRK